jgi:DNA replication protein DnaC
MTMTRKPTPDWCHQYPEPTKRKHIVVAEEPRTCKQHGDFVSKKWALDPPVKEQAGKPIPPILEPFWSQCPVCESDLQREADARDAEIRGGMSQKKILAAARTRAAGIPVRYEASTVWNWQHGMEQQRKVWDWARDYCNQFDLALQSGRSAVFSGSPGTGKTHLAIGVLQHIIEKGGTGLYCTVMSMLGRIKDTFHRDAHEHEADVIEAFRRVDLLVVDEVGKGIDSNYELAQFFRILDLRYQDLKPVLLVSNLGEIELRKFLGEPIVDRMREGGGRLFRFDWASQRSSKPRKDHDE